MGEGRNPERVRKRGNEIQRRQHRGKGREREGQSKPRT